MTFSDEKGVLKRKGSYTFQPFFYNLVHGVSDNNMPLHERAPILGLENLEVRYILLNGQSKYVLHYLNQR